LGDTLVNECHVGDVVLFVVNGPALVEACLTSRAWWPGAVSANVDWFALSFVKVVSLVLLARRVWDTFHESILENIAWISTVAVTTSLTVDDNLGVQSNWGHGKVLEHDVESISNGRGGTH